LACISSKGQNDIQSTPGQVAIVLIHGIGGSSMTWEDAIAGLSSSEFYYLSNLRVIREENFITINTEIKTTGIQKTDRKIPLFTLDFSSNQDLNFIQQAEELRKVCEVISSKFGYTSFILVGHSMGGLAARRYIMDWGSQKIKGLITIATPHLGSFLGYARDLSEQAPIKSIEPRFNLLLENLKNFRLIDEKEVYRNPFEPLFEAYQFTTGINYLSKAAHFLKPSSIEMKQLFTQEFPESLPLAIIISNWETSSKYNPENPTDWFQKVDPVSLMKMLDPANGFDIIKDVLLVNISTEGISQCKTIRDKIPLEILTAQFQWPNSDGLATVASQDIRLGVANGNNLHPLYFYTNRFHTETPNDIDCLKKAIESIMDSIKY
jgi:pimeloyl-ACP methyl ester carboxylesterase